MVQCFAPDCNHRSESDTYRSLVSLAGKKADEYKVDSSIEMPVSTAYSGSHSCKWYRPIMLHPAASLLGMSLSLLFISSKAFLEVGVSSYLNNTVYHVSETKWTLVKPWTVTPRKGFFEATASRGEGFRDRFHTSESGIYFIALNLQMANATSGFLKASLVINGEFEEANGFQGVYGKTNLTETVSLSGFLRLYENDVLALYLYGSEGSMLRDSTFSVMQMSRIGAVPGFHAVLSRGQLIQPQVISRLESWRTSGTKGLFSMHTGTSPSVGLFCAILEGIYQFSSNINVESNIQLTDGIIALVLNSKITLAKSYFSGTRNYSSSISGMFLLNRGDCVEMRVKITSGGHLTVLSGSSFSGLFLGPKREFAQQFSVSLLAQNKVGSRVGWVMADNWTINNSRRNFQSQEMILKTNHSTFIANDNGLFLVTALINVNSSSRTSKHLLVAIKDPPSGLTGNNGLSSGETFSSSRGSLIVSGIVSLDQGDAVTVYVHSNSNDSDVVDGLFCVSVVSYDWPGVTATLTESISLNTSEWTKVTSWITHGVPGLFSFDNAFFPASGNYHPRQEGTYFMSCNVIFKGGDNGNLSVVIAIDDLIDTGNGLYALNENPKPVVTLNVAGSMRLKMSQTVSVYVKTTISSSWNVSNGTGFSVMLIGADSLTTPGFFAVKQEEADQSSSCGEIGRWRTVQPSSDTFFKTSAQFNSTSGRFKAEEDGFYLTSANIIFRHSGKTQISMTIELGGQGGQQSKTVGKTFHPPLPPSSPSGSFVSTLTLASAGRLEPDQYVSIFIECQSGSDWKVLINSSFSVVLVSRWESDYTAGFVTKNVLSENGRVGVVSVIYWEVPNLFSKNLKVPKFQPVTIENSGLYFLSSVVILRDRNGGATFLSGVCIDSEIAFNGITVSKVSEGHIGVFAVSAFGVLHLRRGQTVELCVSSGENLAYKKESGSWFSLVRFLPLRQPPGLHQMLQKSRNISAPCEWSAIRSMSTGGGQLAYINNNISHPNYPTLSCDKGDFTPYFSGAYLISVWFTLRGNLPDTVTACVGSRKCAECYVEFSNTVKQYNNTFGFVGLVDLEKGELLSVCLKSSDHTFSILTATRSVQFLGGVELNGTSQLKHGSLVLNSSGWHALADWETNSNKPVKKFNVIESGLYILSINLQLDVDIERLVGVKLEAAGSSNREVLSIFSNFEADSTVPYSMAVVARMNASEAIAVSVYSNIKSLGSMRNARFFAALVEKSNQFYCLSLRAKTSRYNSGDWWKPIENWVNVDTQCLPTHSTNFSKGIFVADVAGVYFVTAVVMVKTSGLSQQTRLVELLLSVNGDTSSDNGLTATKSVMDSLSVVLSLSATAYLEPWQTLSLMIRNTGVGTFDVINGSMFSVVLLEEAKYYKTVAPNITHFDNGPRVVRHPPPSVSLGEDLGLNVFWSCDAVAEGNVAYSWLKNDQNISSSQDLSLKNVQTSDSGRYVCLAEYDSIKVFSQASELDVFDTSPQFQNKVFTALENSNASLELTFSALNKQRRPANISLDIIKGDMNNTFVLSSTVSKDNFTLRNRIPLDYETLNSYHLTLLATNQDTNKTTTVNVTINISDVNDNPPIFTSRSYDVSVEENTENGTVIFQAKATDEDSGNNPIITYTLLSRECDENFFVDALSGNVTVTGNLDHETRSEVVLCIQATDGKFRATTKLVIAVMDVNEFAPVFNPQFYQRHISETALVGERVIQVFATDKDSGSDSSIFYNITGGNADGTFSIDPDNGTIVLLKSLDYETEMLYELHVQASDGKFSSGANVSIQVVDYNDNSPEFGQASFWFSVPENVTTGHYVGNVSASDKDSCDNANIHYSISSVGNYDKFIINSSTGDIFTDSKLDTETAENYVILVTANDIGNPSRIATTLVNITATDVNDNIPKFVQRNFRVNISEASVLGTNIVCLSTTDPDSMRHSEITYSIANGNVNDTFRVTAEGVVVLQKQLDKETVELYNLTINAGNNGATEPQSHVPAIVIINVVDVNDNSPVFQNLNYSFTVPENVTERYFVGSVTASDRDYDNAHISYSIPSFNDHDKFWINTSTGEIYTNDVLDYETAENYAILVEAHDSGHPPRMAVTLVKIVITDANDNSPEFVDRYLQVNVSEASTIGTQIVCLSTTDRDSMQHSRTSFNISKGNVNNTFSVTDEGVVILQRLLDRETIYVYNLTIDAVDSNSSQLKSSKSAVVIIYVEDINDNYPVFTKDSYFAQMLENVSIGHTVLNVIAHDKDKGSNKVVTYSLVESPWVTDKLANNIFTVNDTTGAISTLKKLKLNASQVEYKFQVKASDKGIPSLESFTNVLVMVEDTNDSPPKFTVCPTTIRVSVKQTEVESEIFRVSTTDADYGSNANATYSIFDENGVFQIRQNGSIYSSVELQAKSTYSINISATDGVEFDFCSVDVQVMAAEPGTNAPQTGGFPRAGKLALIVIGLFLSLILICVFVVWFLRRKNRGEAPVTAPAYAKHSPVFDNDLVSDSGGRGKRPGTRETSI